jgi:hypothetical protein
MNAAIEALARLREVQGRRRTNDGEVSQRNRFFHCLADVRDTVNGRKLAHRLSPHAENGHELYVRLFTQSPRVNRSHSPIADHSHSNAHDVGSFVLIAL